MIIFKVVPLVTSALIATASFLAPSSLSGTSPVQPVQPVYGLPEGYALVVDFDRLNHAFR